MEIARHARTAIEIQIMKDVSLLRIERLSTAKPQRFRTFCEFDSFRAAWSRETS
jgi:hypothetical protein